MRVMFAALRLGIAHRFAYRLEVVVAVVAAIIVVTINASIWSSVVHGRTEVAGLTAVEMSTYVIIAWVAATVCSTKIDEILGHRFRSGELASDLLRPMDLQLFMIARDLGRALVSVALTASPVVLFGALVFPFAWPSHWWSWPALALSLLFGVLIGAQVAFLIGISTFYFKNISGLIRMKAAAVGILSGAVIPLYVMPDWAASIVAWLPFQGMSHIPATLFLERVAMGDLWRPLGLQLLWVLLLAVGCRIAWYRATRHLTVQGGGPWLGEST